VQRLNGVEVRPAGIQSGTAATRSHGRHVGHRPGALVTLRDVEDWNPAVTGTLPFHTGAGARPAA
jgi:hypothetical protein